MAIVKDPRRTASCINPLIGASATDTLDNLCTCLDNMGRMLSNEYDDATIRFFCTSVAAALQFESEQLRAA